MLPENAITAERRRRLVTLCASITRDRAAADDLAQETLLEAWRNGHKVHDPEGLDRWLAAIARNVCRRWARRRGRDAAGLARLQAEPAVQQFEREDVIALLDELPAETREALVLRYVHGASRAEVGERLGISDDAVSMRLTRGKQALRRLLEPDGWVETRIWCVDCGAHRLVMRRTPDTISFRCPSCHPREHERSVDLNLDNPFYARLVGDLTRPTAILRRISEWSSRYFDPAARQVECTRCGKPARLEAQRTDHGLGLVSTCASCAEQAWSSAAALALARPEVQALRRERPRVLLARDTLKVLSAHAA
jgi:RNA polymerase sigma factor (sigma-70 family)